MTDVKTETDPRVRVGFLITELSPGGAEKALFHLATGLDRARYVPVVYSLSGLARDRARSLAPFFRREGVEVVELGARGFFTGLRAFWRLTRSLRRRRVAILQCFMFHANLLGRFAARAARVPVVCAGVRVAERDRKRRLALDRLTGSLVDAWICVGESTARFTRETARIPSERVFSAPNCVRTTRSRQAVLVSTPFDSLAEDESPLRVPAPFGTRRRIVIVGRLAPQKGIDWFLENVAARLDESTRSQWELWLVGDGPQERELRRICRERGLDDFVFFTGWRADARRIIAESELFALPSRWEGMSNSLLEAVALGRATLCRAVEGVEEVLGDAAPSQACYSDDPEEWSQKLLALLRDDERRRELGLANQRRALTEFTQERVAARYDAIWTSLLRARGVSTPPESDS